MEAFSSAEIVTKKLQMCVCVYDWDTWNIFSCDKESCSLQYIL